jgi:glycosyltransferase involved in cell wall biosynthesis
MNQIYAILGAPLWRLLGKKIGLWYAHGTVSQSLKLATHLTNYIFTSTPEGFRIKTPKRVIVGQGIDTTLFTPAQKLSTDIKRLVTVGRISPSKNIDTLLRACALLRDNGTLFHFRIVGVATTPAEKQYEVEVRQLASQLNLEDSIEWTGAVSNRALPPILQQSYIFIHDGATNSLDKTLLEAALCGCIVVSSNPAYKSLTEAIAPEYLFPLNDEKALANIIKNNYQYTENMTKVNDLVKEKFTIQNLISGIVTKFI